jgi:hypothetical protein
MNGASVKCSKRQRGEVCLGAAKECGSAIRFHQQPLRSPFACSEGDLPLPKSLKGAILASKPPGSGECRLQSVAERSEQALLKLSCRVD